jgi:hypothetical protein
MRVAAEPPLAQRMPQHAKFARPGCLSSEHPSQYGPYAQQR